MSKQEQQKNAMDQLFNSLSTQPQTVQESAPKQDTKQSAQTSSIQRKYNEENERVCTIVNVELMNKARYIAGKEGIALRDIFEYGLRFAIIDYEKKHGVISVRKSKPKKGDASKVFNI